MPFRHDTAIGAGAVGYVDHVFVQIFSTPVMQAVSRFYIWFAGAFYAVGYGSLISGIKRMPPHMMESGLIMGYRFPVLFEPSSCRCFAIYVAEGCGVCGCNERITNDAVS